MQEELFNKVLEQGFNILLLCAAIYYMHKRVEKIESQREALTKDLVNLQLKTAEALDRLSDKLDNIINYGSINKKH
ncbi:MAG: hypothetical protein GY865_10970 [candidate division Zixibacteria bacterium]|jgi:hypothetical protein|nr:hypothetical protein [candidate division Zixibacteria bacterium]